MLFIPAPPIPEFKEASDLLHWVSDFPEHLIQKNTTLLPKMSMIPEPPIPAFELVIELQWVSNFFWTSTSKNSFQRCIFQSLYLHLLTMNWPPRLLIADTVEHLFWRSTLLISSLLNSAKMIVPPIQIELHFYSVRLQPAKGKFLSFTILKIRYFWLARIPSQLIFSVLTSHFCRINNAPRIPRNRATVFQFTWKVDTCAPKIDKSQRSTKFSVDDGTRRYRTLQASNVAHKTPNVEHSLISQFNECFGNNICL
jgi:hypothetical protein